MNMGINIKRETKFTASADGIVLEYDECGQLVFWDGSLKDKILLGQISLEKRELQLLAEFIGEVIKELP